MNELQAKLARRRTLNGEIDESTSTNVNLINQNQRTEPISTTINDNSYVDKDNNNEEAIVNISVEHVTVIVETITQTQSALTTESDLSIDHDNEKHNNIVFSQSIESDSQLTISQNSSENSLNVNISDEGNNGKTTDYSTAGIDITNGRTDTSNTGESNITTNPNQIKNNKKWYPGKYLGIKPKSRSSVSDNQDSVVDTSSTAVKVSSETLDDFLKDKDSFLNDIQEQVDISLQDKKVRPANRSYSLSETIQDLNYKSKDSFDSASDGAIQMRQRITHLISELHKRDAYIESLEKEIASLREKLANSLNLDNRVKHPRKSSIVQQLRIYGFDRSNVTFSEYNNETSELFRSQSTSNNNNNLLFNFSPNANKQLTDLLNLEEKSIQSSNRQSFDSTSLKNLSVSVLTRHPSTTRDPLTTLSEVAEDESIILQDSRKLDILIGDLQLPEYENKVEEIECKPAVAVDNSEDVKSDLVKRFSQPQCADIINRIVLFVFSIVGPLGDGKPPNKRDKVDYIFYGTKHLEKRCVDFFEDIYRCCVDNQVFKDASEELLENMRDWIEMQVMVKIYSFAVTAVEKPQEDEALLKRMKLLSFLQPEALDIKQELRDEESWRQAIECLAQIDNVKSPFEKASYIVKCATVIFQSINNAQERAASREADGAIGADDFLPVFIYVVLQSKIPRLYTNCEYIQAFLNPTRLMSRLGYCFVNLQSALEFIMNLDAESVNMDPVIFKQLLLESEQRLGQ